MADDDPPLQERYCSRCAVSLVPLSGTFIEAACKTCGKNTFFFRPGDNGKGIKLEVGDILHLSPISISLKPGSSTLTRSGLRWFLNMLFLAPQLRSLEVSYETIFSEIDRQFDEVLNRSKFFIDNGITVESAQSDDWARFQSQMPAEQDSEEFWAFMGSIFLSRLRSSRETGDLDAALSNMFRATSCLGIVSTMGDVEDAIWRGYQWNKKIFDVSGVVIQSPDNAEALETLATKLDQLSDVALTDLIGSRDDLSAAMDLTALSSAQIKNVAKFVIDTRLSKVSAEIERRKVEAAEAQVDIGKRQLQHNRHAVWITAIAAFSGTLIAAGLAFLAKIT